MKRLRHRLRERQYDLVIDAQGLLKSAWPARWAGAPVAGYDRRSIREPLASLFYQHRFSVSRELHAIERIRRLFAHALGYPLPEAAPDYGLAGESPGRGRTLLFLHGTTWPSKLWPESYWIELARLAKRAGYRVAWPWHGETERARAQRLQASGGGELLPELDLDGLRARLLGAAGAVGVDSGLAHLAAALGTPAVTLYGPTRTGLTGAAGARQRNLESTLDCAPCLRRNCPYPGKGEVEPACFELLTPEIVWQTLMRGVEGRA
jgi:heptosyltransferase-1